MNNICGDNRFELIKKYKQMLIENTNIEMAKDEMAVIDNILFRFWQMNWLDKLEQLPSAQPKKRTEERTETHACDLISRQAAIDAILAVTGNSSVRELYEHVQEHGLSEMWSGGVNAAIDIIIALPSAQPEIIRCKECKHQVKEWRTDKRFKNKGYMVCGCDVVGDACGYWALLGQDDDCCSMAERRTDEND